MAIQIRNDELVELLRPDFQARYESNFAWKSLTAAISCLPGLRVAFTTAAFDSNADIFGTSTFGPGAVLSYNGNPQFGYDYLAPYVQLDGTGDYFDRADDANNSITGTETYVQAAYRGLTIGTWVYPTSLGAEQAIWGKWNENAVNQRSYLIDLTAGNVFRGRVSSAGTAATISTVTSSVTVTANSWYYVSMTFDPSTRLTIDVNGTIDHTVAGVQASAFDSTASLVLGARDNGASALFTGRLSASWLCCMFHGRPTATDTDYWIEVLREQTRAMYRE